MEQSIEYRGHVIKIMQDDSSESPRGWDNVGTMVCWHRRYTLGDKHNFKTPGDFMDWWKTQEGVLMPLYLYDHSGITISTAPFSCPWDSGQIGYIYATKETINKEYGKGPAAYKKTREYLTGEVKTYDDYLTGNVYGFTIEGPNCDDSCWGYYHDEKGLDYLIEECKASIDHAINRAETAQYANVVALQAIS